MKLKLLTLFLMLCAWSTVTAQSSQSNQAMGTTETEFSILPNPGINELNIKLVQKKHATVEVYNLLGRKIYTGKLTQMNSSIDITQWKSGIYLVKVITNEKSMTKRFVKR